MNKIKQYLIISLCCLNSLLFSASSLIVESNHMSDLIQYITPDTLIVLDIDNTVLEPAQSLGSDQWAWDRVKKLKGELSEREAIDQTSKEWCEVHSITKVRTVENSTADLIQCLQSNKHALIALTTRRPIYAEITLRELHDLGIDFSQTSLPVKNCDFSGRNILYKEGIAFISLENRKGEVLKEMLKNNEYHPQTIVFVDDKLAHVKDVAKACTELDINYIGLRYSAADRSVGSFDRETAETQQYYMNHILTDREADTLKKCKGENHE